jgi:DNA repair photolyase
MFDSRNKVTAVKRQIRYESLPVKSLLNAVKAPSMPFEWSINPYRGCQHGCAFCYARGTHSFLGVEADDTFQNRIFLKTNGPEALREQLGKMFRLSKKGKPIGHIAIGTATDPYQQAEAKAMLTRQCLEVLAEYPASVSITTRSPLILRDIDLLRRIPGITVHVSIGTLRADMWRSFEPSSPSPRKRLETVKRLREEGIATEVFIAPILPHLTDGADDLRQLIAAVADCRPHRVMASILRLNTREVKLWFFRILHERFPHLTETYAELYRGSPYAPDSYRDPVKQMIRSLLKQYGLHEEDMRSRPDDGTAPRHAPPPAVEQLYLF